MLVVELADGSGSDNKIGTGKRILIYILPQPIVKQKPEKGWNILCTYLIENRNFNRGHEPSAAPLTNHPYIQSEIPHSSP